MKALSAKQPWATLIVEGIKDIENRTWKCPEKYIGQRVLIHAGARPFGNLKPDSCISHILTESQCDYIWQRKDSQGLVWLDTYQFGAIIGSVQIVDCVGWINNHSSIWAEKSVIHRSRELSKPIYNWVFANPIKFPEPIPAKGKLGFWDFPDIIAEPEEKDGELFCHCQLPVKLENQVSVFTGERRCRYCGAKWYR